MTGSLPVEFVGSYPDPLVPLHPSRAEFALLGRSNVGKSTLLNALVGRRSLARVSADPGKTTLMNVFRLPACYLLDLPGYGYARRSRTARADFRRLLEAVVRQRPTLTGIVWLLDVRHPPSREDLAIRDLLGRTGRPVLAVLTKADKLSRERRVTALADRAGELGLPADQLILTSGTTGLGIEDLRRSVLAAAGP
ncbi:MAG TPA: ribosome biogenesis GTP-binding protein YihA/YsxC [Gemmatimonadales bacterium]|nr:ribosome biogenesis GTP-binding protein YihA/YsxC [Gemmatimonadales bacterium]